MTYTIGLVSDTHYPERCSVLPSAMFDVLQGADLILHAGDVGELVVLDRLSECAPVLAVRGNDDTEAAKQSLPYKAVVAIANTRLLLWHSHYEDRRQEFESRQGDEFLPKLQRSADLAKSVGASVAVFGHWHIPLVYPLDDVILVNPGAVASGNVVTRQLVQTVALLSVDDDGSCSVRHVDLAHPDEVYEPNFRVEEGFVSTLQRFSSSIFSPELLAKLHGGLGKVSADDQELLRPFVYTLAQRCWAGEFESIDMALMRDEFLRTETISTQDKERLLHVLSG